MNKIKPLVFLPPFLICLVAILFSLWRPDPFNAWVTGVSNRCAESFGWLISLASFGMVLICIAMFVSPFGRTILGGPGARRLLTRWQMFAVVLTTNIAAGILFWCAYEPTNYFTKPPLGIVPKSPEAAQFAISTIYLHWSFTPYCIPSVIGLMFAFAYYNMKRPFSLGAPLSPLLGRHGEGGLAHVVDAVCLYSLLAAIAAALAGASLLLGAGIDHLVLGGDAPSKELLATIIGTIMVTSVAAAISGVTKGIRYIADANTWFLIGFLGLIVALGPTRFICNFAVEGLGQFLGHYCEKVLWTGAAHGEKFPNQYTQMLFAAFFAWGPIMGVFLGRIAHGYSVREFLFYNVVLPALFTGVWMAVFCGAIVHSELYGAGGLAAQLDDNNPTKVLFAFLSQLRHTEILIPILLLTAFLSFVTTADGCTDTMANISTRGISPDHPESSKWVKIVWGAAIAILAYSMVADKRLQGVRNLSNLGGYPALFLGLAAAASAIKVISHPARYDRFHAEYAAQSPHDTHEA